MSFLSRLLGTQADPREAWRPLWHRLVGVAREEHWYARRGAADTLDGRFDMISMLTALFMLRLENEPDGVPAAARLTELAKDVEGRALTCAETLAEAAEQEAAHWRSHDRVTLRGRTEETELFVRR